MDFDLLEAFLAVVEARSFSGAARALHSTQPTVSRQIARLESDLGVQLFERGGRTVEPTPVGQMLVPMAKAITVRVDEAVSTVRGHVGAGSRTIRFGAPRALFSRSLAAVLVSFALAYPNVRVDLVEKDDTLVEEAVARGELDCGVITAWRSNRTAVQHLLTDEIVVLVGDSHDLARRQEVELAALAKETLLLPPSTMNVANIVVDAFREAGLQPRLGYRVETPELLAELVRSSLAIAPVPATLLPEKRDGLAVLHLPRPLKAEVVFVSPKDRPVAPGARALGSHIKAALAGTKRPGARPLTP